MLFSARHSLRRLSSGRARRAASLARRSRHQPLSGRLIPAPRLPRARSSRPRESAGGRGTVAAAPALSPRRRTLGRETRHGNLLAEFQLDLLLQVAGGRYAPTGWLGGSSRDRPNSFSRKVPAGSRACRRRDPARSARPNPQSPAPRCRPRPHVALRLYRTRLKADGLLAIRTYSWKPRTEPIVRRLRAGGNWIRTSGSARDSVWFSWSRCLSFALSRRPDRHRRVTEHGDSATLKIDGLHEGT
jgi:hypothetical protein